MLIVNLALSCAFLLRAYASISNNLAYDSPSYRVRQLETPRHVVEARHAKRWEYYDGPLSFPYDVASGDPWPESVILWTHPVPSTADPRPVCLEYQVSAANDSFSSLVASEQVWTTSDVDYSYKVEAGGLQPKTTYYYRVYSCSNYPFGFFNAYGNAARRDSIDYAVHVGDYIYEYQGDGCDSETACYGDGRDIDRVPMPNREIWTLDDYRERYKTYRSDPDLQLLHQTHAWQLVWDDHEVADNTWKAGSADSNDTLVGSFNGTDFTQRKANAVKTYFEWLPIRTVETDDRLRIYRTFKIGTLADLIMLDTRQYNRDLTDLQENWFYEQLRNASAQGAQWKVVGQQIVFAHLESVDDVDAHANWVSDIAYDNRTEYNPNTGEGAFGVEFAGTAVSSPSSFDYNSTLNGPYPEAYYTSLARQLVNTTGNEELQWTEGATRGYSRYYGIDDVRTRNTQEKVLATFVVKDKANKLQRPVADGRVTGGALRG
ncbi:hypothetical protein IAU60_006886 [Kwoniella sp. DSM 27419]